MSSGNSSASGGIGFGGLLTVLFIGLKLGNVIIWPWFSLNPFELSVFIVPVVGIWIAALLFVGVMFFGLIKKMSK
jgi:hypothetical protein